MKYFFFLLLLTIASISNTSALESVRFSHASSLPFLSTDMFGAMSHTYVDFNDIVATKIHHIAEIFPKNSEENLSPAKISEYTPEFQRLKNHFPADTWNTLWYPWNTGKRTQKINLHTQVFSYEGIDDDWSPHTLQTNTNNILYYSVESPHDTIQRITIYPIDPRYYWFIDYSTGEHFAFLGREEFLPKDIQTNADIPIPPLVMVGSDLDMYDISVETDDDKFTKTFSPKHRKLQLTQFGPTYQLSSYGELGQTLYTLLPYYEVDIPLKKGYNTVRVTYQSFTSMPESIKETLRIDK